MKVQMIYSVAGSLIIVHVFGWTSRDRFVSKIQKRNVSWEFVEVIHGIPISVEGLCKLKKLIDKVDGNDCNKIKRLKGIQANW